MSLMISGLRMVNGELGNHCFQIVWELNKGFEYVLYTSLYCHAPNLHWSARQSISFCWETASAQPRNFICIHNYTCTSFQFKSKMIKLRNLMALYCSEKDRPFDQKQFNGSLIFPFLCKSQATPSSLLVLAFLRLYDFLLTWNPGT